MIRVYSKENCPNCVKAKNLLISAGISFEVIEINPENIESLRTLGVRSAPAIFDGDTFMGSYKELLHFVKDSQ
jgi:glutaredoxin 3